MTSLTSEEKEALKEVFLCFQVEEKWYERGIIGKIFFSKFFCAISKAFSYWFSKVKNPFFNNFNKKN